eukprot:GHVU01153569.1.p1 GENE.GHVU01153569.1~~GHVU01153569.1.p1  ORF type:complete len:260 (+),score=48.62 GHVU01153569.1:352-1131(+)
MHLNKIVCRSLHEQLEENHKEEREKVEEEQSASSYAPPPVTEEEYEFLKSIDRRHKAFKDLQRAEEEKELSHFRATRENRSSAQLPRQLPAKTNPWKQVTAGIRIKKRKSMSGAAERTDAAASPGEDAREENDEQSNSSVKKHKNMSDRDGVHHDDEEGTGRGVPACDSRASEGGDGKGSPKSGLGECSTSAGPRSSGCDGEDARRRRGEPAGKEKQLPEPETDKPEESKPKSGSAEEAPGSSSLLLEGYADSDDSGGA